MHVSDQGLLGKRWITNLVFSYTKSDIYIHMPGPSIIIVYLVAVVLAVIHTYKLEQYSIHRASESPHSIEYG